MVTTDQSHIIDAQKYRERNSNSTLKKVINHKGKEQEKKKRTKKNYKKQPENSEQNRS